jgi:uncharacterized protein (TIGR02145 family)
VIILKPMKNNRQEGKMKQKRILLYILILFFIRSGGLEAQAVKDADGNIYMTINIGKQIWIAENLKTTKLNDGKPIPLVTDEKAWKALKSPGYCLFNNDPANKDIYGALFNWYTVDTKKICPKGWHVPSDTEWKTMVDFLGDKNTASDKLKESGNDHWKNALINATDDFDFKALPGGTRLYSGSFPEFGSSYAVWWTSTEYSSLVAYNWGLHDSSSKVFNGYDSKQNGFSVRCIQD